MHIITGSLPGPGASEFDPTQPREHVRVHHLRSLDRRISPRDLIAFVELVRLFRRERFDLVHTHMSKGGILGRLAARAARVPVVVHTAHGWSLYHSDSRLVRAGVRAVEHLAARVTDRLLVVSEYDRRIAIDNVGIDPARLGAGHRGVPLPPPPGPEDRGAARRALGLGPDALVYGTVVRLVWHKRVQDLVQAAAALRRSVPEATCVVVGSGPEEAALRLLAQRIAPDIVFRLAYTPVEAILPAFDVFVHPSEFEGLPGVVIKALSFGVAVVAEDAGGTADLVREGETGVLVRVGDVAELTTAITRLLRESESRRRMGEAGRSLVAARYALDDRVRAIEDVYLNLLAARPPR
jgi:glycosyltransferase involved in cell wall biosynthesis